MKATKSLYRYHLWLVIVMVFSAETLSAQSPKIGTVLADLSVGKLIRPDASIKTLGSLYQNGSVILNYWATWCKPCILEMKLLAGQLHANMGSFSVLSITYEDKATVERFLKANPDLSTSKLNIVYQDRELNTLFFHQALPHNVWVEKGGKIAAITGGEELNAESLKLFLAGKLQKMSEKKEVAFDWTKPFVMADTVPLLRSTFLKRLPGVEMSGYTVSFGKLGYPNGTMFRAFNVQILTLFWSAYQFVGGVNPDLYEVITRDSARYFSPDTSRIARGIWGKSNTYSYELISRKPLDDSVFYPRVIADLELAFGIESRLKLSRKLVYEVRFNTERDFPPVAVRVGEGKVYYDKSKLIIKAVPTAYLLDWIFDICSLNPKYKRKSPYLNKTGISYPISGEIDLGNDKSLYKNLMHLEKCLTQQLGLEFKQYYAEYPILVLKDK